MKIALSQRWKLILSGCLFLILAHWMALVFRIQPAVSLWFPPSGVAVLLAIWLGPIGIGITGLVSVIMAPMWGSDGWQRLVGLTDASEPFMAWFFYCYCWRGSLTLNSLKSALAWVVSAPILAAGTCAVVGSLSLTALGQIDPMNLSSTILHWWVGNAIGIMTLTPPALLLLTPMLDRAGWLPESYVRYETTGASSSVGLPSRSLQWAEMGAIVILMVGTAWLAVMHAQSGGLAFQQFSFLNFVAIIWAATRFGAIGGVMTASFCVFFTLIAYLIFYPNALALPRFPVAADVLHVHKLTLLVQSVVSLLVGVAITQQSKIQVSLVAERVRSAEFQARADLGARLQEANRSLEIANVQLQQSNFEKDELLRSQQAARQEAETANRMKDHFLAVVSHELRSPLNPILGWAHLLRSRSYDQKTLDKALEVIERNAKLQSQLIEDLLDVSRILRDKLRLDCAEVELETVIEAAIETVHHHAAEKDIQIYKRLSSCTVLGDQHRLQQIVWNLLSNSIKFTPSGGKVQICLDRVDAWARIQISDTGKGIDPEFLPYLFEAFWQEDNSTSHRTTYPVHIS